MYIIPAVETVNKEVPLPTTLAELQESLREHEVCSFYGHYCKACHNPTRIQNFVKVSEPYAVDFEEGFEPYVVAHRSNPRHLLPRYLESFIGRGWDKMSFFFELFLQRRPFVAFPHYFLAHHGRGDMPTTYSTAYMARQSKNLQLNIEFKERVRKQYAENKPSDPLGQFPWSDFTGSSSDDGMVCRAKGNASVEALEQALSYACGHGVDCTPLQHFPPGISHHASWAFHRYFLIAKENETAEVACDFQGVAELVRCDGPSSMVRGGVMCLPRENITNATRLQAAVDWLCGNDGPLGGDCAVLKKAIVVEPPPLNVLASMAFHMYYLLHRCGDVNGTTCDFEGLAELRRR